MAAVETETVPSEWCQMIWGVCVAAMGTETVPSEWCQMMGWGVWQQWEQKPCQGGLWFNVSLLTLSFEAGLHEVLTVDLLCVCVLSA